MRSSDSSDSILSHDSVMSLARSISTLAFVVSAVVHLGLVQSAGGLLDSCNAFGFVGVSAEECHAITTSVQRTGGQAEKDMLALAFAAMRGECCQFIGMGAGSVYALLFLSKGTDEAGKLRKGDLRLISNAAISAQ